MAPPERTPINNAREGFTIKGAAEDVGVHWQTIRNWMRNYDAGEPDGLPYTEFGSARPGRRRIIRIHPRDLYMRVYGTPEKPD